jgi:hypothetical protein
MRISHFMHGLMSRFRALSRVTGHVVSRDREAARWQLECTRDGQRTTFDGATVSRSIGGLIAELREDEGDGA